MRKLLVAVAAAALALSACSSGGGAGSDGNVTITFWDNNGGPAREPIYKELISRFEAANPTIKV
ncbi:sugar ABC transporter substrate-binding protein, partial [Saccharothrix sp. MB29]|nr:sugar ABC transporter substrate-binding protein [Saccharothrix sp. MB29]